MAAVPMTFQCIVYPRDKSVKPYPATLVGVAWATGLEVGGGPIIPPEITVPPDVGIWPPDPWLPSIEHPIVLPPVTDPPPIDPPDPPNMVKPPPPQGGWAWSPVFGWIYVPGPGTPGPKRGR